MITKKPSDNFSDFQKKLSPQIFDLVVGRIFKKVYLSLDANSQKNMEELFASTDDAKKEEFIKKNIPNFKKIFEQEAKKLEKEIKSEINGQL